MVGPSYTARSTAVADEELFNWYYESLESQGSIVAGKSYGGQAAQSVASFFYTPGLKIFTTFPQGPTRGSLLCGSRLFVVSGPTLFEVSPSGAQTNWGTVGNDGNPASLAFNNLQLLVVSNGQAFCFTLATNTLLEVTSLLTAVPLKVRFDDSYFVVSFQNSNRFQMSQVLDGTTWPGQLVNEVSVFPDNVTAIEVNHRELWVFGARHSQPYQDTGSTEVFDVIPGAFIEKGCAAPFVTCLLDNSVFWVDEDDRGGRSCWRSNGYTPQRISTYAVEIDLQSYPTVAGMTSYSYQDGGHLFWVLYVPGSYWSWVYDVVEGLWHKRAAWSSATGKWTAHASWNHVYAFGLHLVGDWNSGNLYVMTQNAFTDYGNTIRRLRRSPTVINEMNWIFHSELTADFDMGNLSNVIPTDQAGFAAALYGPKGGGAAVNTAIAGGEAWTDPLNVLTNNNAYATSSLISETLSANNTGGGANSIGGGVAWTNPIDVYDPVSYASVSLSSGSPTTVTPTNTAASVSNAASPSNQAPSPVLGTLSGFPSTALTDATLYVTFNTSVSAIQGGGNLYLRYSVNNGVTWKQVASWNITTGPITIPIALTGITNLDTVQLQMEADCGCGPAGYANVALNVTNWYATIAGSGQDTAQALIAGITGLTVPAGCTILGVQVSFVADYSGVAPFVSLNLNVGNPGAAIPLTTSPATYTAGGPTDLWGYNGWSNAVLSSLTPSFFASSTGTTTVNINTLVVTAYYSESITATDALDVTAFGFAIPLAANPLGIKASLVAFAVGTGATLNFQLLKNLVPVGPIQSFALGSNPEVFTFGGFNQLFNTPWLYTDLNSGNFGLRITASLAAGNAATINIGYPTLEIYAPPLVPNYDYIGPIPVLVDGAGNPRPPQIMLRWSDNRGKTWSNEHILNLGFSGQYNARAVQRRLGRSRYRVYEISATDPVPYVMVDAYLTTAQ